MLQDAGHDDLTVVARDEFGQYRVMVAIPFAKVFIVGSRPEYVAHYIAPARRMVFEQGGQQSGGNLQDAVLQYVGCFRHVDTLI